MLFFICRLKTGDTAGRGRVRRGTRVIISMVGIFCLHLQVLAPFYKEFLKTIPRSSSGWIFSNPVLEFKTIWNPSHWWWQTLCCKKVNPGFNVLVFGLSAKHHTKTRICKLLFWLGLSQYYWFKMARKEVSPTKSPPPDPLTKWNKNHKMNKFQQMSSFNKSVGKKRILNRLNYDIISNKSFVILSFTLSFWCWSHYVTDKCTLYYD